MEDNNKTIEGFVKIAFVSYVMIMLISLMIELRHVKNDMDNLRYEIEKLKGK